MDKNQVERLASFKRANNGMIAKNASSYSGWGNRIWGERTKDYSLKEIEEIISSTSLSEMQKLSRFHFNKNGFYKRLLVYYATLLKYVGITIPNPSFGNDLSKPHIQKRYFNAVNFIERLNLPILLANWAQRALIDGCYYGIIQTVDNKGIVTFDLPADYCRTRFKDTLGNDIIEFNLSYFNTIILEDERAQVLRVYPKIISSSYEKWRKGKINDSWIFIPTDISICFPLFDGRPPFLPTIPATLAYDDTVDIELKRNIEEIQKIIVQKIPHLTDGRLVFEPEEAEEMHSGTVGMLKGNDNVSVLTTYADVDAIISKTSAEGAKSSLDNMVQNIYHTTGTSSELFASTGSSTLEYSIDNDIAFMMVLANKFALFITNLINRLFANSNVDFKYMILPVSYYNEGKYIENCFKLASSGYSILMPSIALGINQRDLGNLKDLENNALKLTEKLIPLKSAYTQSDSGSESGRPQKDPTEKTEGTIKKEKSLDNQTGGSN